ncbi:MAG TPA: CarD family transcriptional regulator [Nannocystaceae bacterium]|nr:CarD family transcriptional regulator [Nannocystaceae bacterium]
MTDFEVGEKAVYPGHGVAEIVGIERKEISGAAMEFYVLRVLENEMKVMVPKRNAVAVGLRRLVGSAEIREVYDVLNRRGEKISTATWNRRHREYMEKIKTGSLSAIATVMRDLCILRSDKDLSFGERKMLDTARTLLVQELALAKGVAESDMAQELEALFAATA